MKVLGRALAATATALVLPAVALVSWEWAANAGHLQPTYFPAPSRIARSIGDLAGDGLLFREGRSTVLRMTIGWALAGIVGVAAGCALGRAAWLRTALWPILEFARAIPAAAIVPAGLLVLGVGARMEITVVAIAALWPVLINTTAAVAATEPVLMDSARVFGLSNRRQILGIQLPVAAPSILAGLRTSLAVSLIVAVLAEMIASTSGLGNAIVEARSRYRTADVYAIVVALGIIGVITNFGLELVERHLTRWQRPSAGQDQSTESAAMAVVAANDHSETEEH